MGISRGESSEPLLFSCFSGRSRRYSWISVFLPPFLPDPSDLWGIQDEFGAGEAVCLQCPRLLPGECGGSSALPAGDAVPSHREAPLTWPSCLLLAFLLIPRYSHHRRHHHHHHHHFPLWIVWTTSRPASMIHWCWLFPPHNFPWEVSQPNPAHQMFRTDISDWGKEGACFDNSCLNSGPLDYLWSRSSSETESDFVLFSHLSKIKLLDSSRTHSFSTYL